MKNSRWKNKESPLHLQDIIFLHHPIILNDTLKAQLLCSMKLKRMIELWQPKVFLETLSIYIHLKMEMEEFVA